MNSAFSILAFIDAGLTSQPIAVALFLIIAVSPKIPDPQPISRIFASFFIFKRFKTVSAALVEGWAGGKEPEVLITRHSSPLLGLLMLNGDLIAKFPMR